MRLQTKFIAAIVYRSNRFAMTVRGKSQIGSASSAPGLRARGVSTVPSTMEEEKQTNPFLRWDSKEIQTSVKASSPGNRHDPVSVFAAVRKMKDAF
jgi:hydroxyacylglutathione hydrolase